MNVKEIGQIIKYHRKISGLSRNDCATLAGVGKTVIFDLENGKETVQLRSLLRIMHVLNIQLKLESPLMEQFYQKNQEI